ncbi:MULTISPECIES: hypothetical protein [Neisseria]|uniref:hypothetical protein n=1 Tax=Neisseria TaxID=482 RepID=UPI00189C6BAA|nr:MULTISPECIES: hypothetical protein [Neisseria]
MSFYRRNQDWQAYGQHRRRVWTRQARKKQETADEYQARMKRETEELMKKEQEK